MNKAQDGISWGYFLGLPVFVSRKVIPDHRRGQQVEGNSSICLDNNSWLHFRHEHRCSLYPRDAGWGSSLDEWDARTDHDWYQGPNL